MPSNSSIERGDRRLNGWPKEWPIEPNGGQFYIMLPSWMRDDCKQLELTGARWDSD